MSSQLEKRIMKRVYYTYLLRYFRTKVGLKLLALVAIMSAISGGVSIKNVSSNMPSITDPITTLSFFGGAFINTEISIQLFVAGFFVIACLFMVDLVKLEKVEM